MSDLDSSTQKDHARKHDTWLGKQLQKLQSIYNNVLCFLQQKTNFINKLPQKNHWPEQISIIVTLQFFSTVWKHSENLFIINLLFE